MSNGIGGPGGPEESRAEALKQRFVEEVVAPIDDFLGLGRDWEAPDNGPVLCYTISQYLYHERSNPEYGADEGSLKAIEGKFKDVVLNTFRSRILGESSEESQKDLKAQLWCPKFCYIPSEHSIQLSVEMHGKKPGDTGGLDKLCIAFITISKNGTIEFMWENETGSKRFKKPVETAADMGALLEMSKLLAEVFIESEKGERRKMLKAAKLYAKQDLRPEPFADEEAKEKSSRQQGNQQPSRQKKRVLTLQENTGENQATIQKLQGRVRALTAALLLMVGAAFAPPACQTVKDLSVKVGDAAAAGIRILNDREEN
jgi:hypothetical protein